MKSAIICDINGRRIGRVWHLDETMPIFWDIKKWISHNMSSYLFKTSRQAWNKLPKREHFRLSKIKFFKRSLIASITCLGAIAPITATTAQNNSSPKIVSTFLPIHLFTKAVVGDTGEVDILISPGAEVHDYQATPDRAISF